MKFIFFHLCKIKLKSILVFQLRDCELGAIVNRDLSRRIRTVTGLTANKQVIQHDMKLSARIIQNLDAKTGLWQESQQQQEQVFFLLCVIWLLGVYYLLLLFLCKYVYKKLLLL